MKIKLPLMIILILFSALNIYAEYDPPSQGDMLYDFYSPESLASGSPLISTEAPLACFNNPAAGGFLQRNTAALNYTALHGSASDEGWGNVVNAGLSIPSDIGVYSASVLFLNSSFDSPDYGNLGRLGFAFSKDLYSNLSAGASLNLIAGSNDSGDWGLGFDLGILHYPVVFLNDYNFRWGAVFKNIGKGYSASDSADGALPSLFTPGVGAGITLIEKEAFSFDLNTDLLFPAFQNLRSEIGAVFNINNLFDINLSSRFDLNEISDDFNPAPSIGISFGFNADLRKFTPDSFDKKDLEKTEVHTSFAYTKVNDNVNAYSAGFRIPFGIRDEKGPDIDINYKDIVYISPDNDGKSDDLVFPVEIKDERYVKGYEFVITDTEGNIVRQYGNKDERPENISFENIFDRITYVKTGISVPENFRWDGNNNERTEVPDGEYLFYVKSWDDNGNVSESKKYNAVVDTVNPEISVTAPPALDRIFSPNGDGSRDFLTLRQSGSKEDLWKGEVKDNNGKTVKTFKWENSSPADIFWNGADDDGILLPDGVYTYEISSEDRAQNSSLVSVANIIISTMSTPASLSISRGAFSPDNDGSADSLDFSFNVPVKKGISGWVLDILDRSGNIVNSFEGGEEIPENFTFHGLSKNKSFLPEGDYSGRLQIVYKNGNMPEALSPDFIIDITPPDAGVSAEYNVFSPNNDSKKDFLLIQQKTSSEELWTGLVKNKDGRTVLEKKWFSSADPVFKWDAVADSGRRAPDGEYTYQLSSVDRAGNSGLSAPLRFVIDTEETPLMITREYEVFSPNGDGVKDSIRFFPEVKKKDGIKSYDFRIKSEDGRTVFEKSGKRSVPELISWDGKEAENEKDRGGYSASINVEYINGNNPSASTGSFAVDTEFPVLEIKEQYTVFSPNSDGRKDLLPVDILSSSREELWTGKVTDEKGNVVREFNWEKLESRIFWDGKDNSGNILPDGEYSFVIASEDAGGSRTEKSIKRIILDNRITSAILSVSRDGFSPNSDDYYDNLEFSIFAAPLDGIESWNLDITDKSGKTVKTFSGGENIPGALKWNGLNDNNEVEDSIYRAELSVLYKKGDNPVSKTREFILDTNAPSSDIVITPYPFSPDNDGVDDEVSVILNLEDLSGIDTWALDIYDPAGNLFKTFKGNDRPAEKIIWDGMSDTGELVQAAEDYPFVLTSKDNLGNINEKKGIIPVDILVIREGDKLKIRISSIKFAPNLPDLVEDIPEVKEKNEKIIKRLSEILNKYSSYNIKIEGHANNLSFADPAKAAVEEKEELIPLSNARCNTVRNILDKNGVDKDRITMEGLGGTEPVVPFSDLKNRWKNRRVEFILIK